MPASPHRPFVPHRTPKREQQPIAPAEFSLSRPFVPGSEREKMESSHRPMPANDVDVGSTVRLRSIDYFLESPSVAEPDELPPIEHFVDPLPSVDEFESRIGDFVATDSATDDSATTRDSAADSSGWVETDWQQYDWRAAAALAESPDSAASTAWASTDWEGGAGARRAKDVRPTAAQAIASALDQIAQRIRDGELAVPGAGTSTDPAAIAATLASLLGIKR